MAVMSKPGEWAINHVPAVNVAATISKAARAGFIHVCTGFVVTAVAGTSAPTATVVTWELRDGATGAGTILLSGKIGIPATAGAVNVPVVLSGAEIPGTVNTAMTLEFTAAGGANTFETVSLFGYDKPEGA